MLEEPRAVKITTAALAAKLEVSEAALYRHFASKAQMFEGLIEFIEATLFSLINKLTDEEKSGHPANRRDNGPIAWFRAQESGYDACPDRRRAHQRERAPANPH